MISNLVNQLREMDALDKLDQVFEELPRVRRELGQVPLVTPTSQIVGIQTVNNVLFDTEDERYKMITAQVKDLCYGLYGETPAPINPEVQKKALQDYPRGSEPCSCRPADILEPELDKAKEDIKDLAKDIDDVLIYALYPTTGKKFLRWKHGFEEMPEEVKPKTLEDAKREQELVEKAKRGELVEKPAKEPPAKGENLRTFNVFVDEEYFRVEVENTDSRPLISSITPMGQPQQPAQQPVQQPQPAQQQPQQQPQQPEPAPSAPKEEPKPSSGGGIPVEAPMPGMIIRYDVQEGDSVNEGDVLLILEAMKMENSITAPSSGTVREVRFKEGDNVQKGDVLAVVG
jgi:pyruvate carboxylase subunit B